MANHPGNGNFGHKSGEPAVNHSSPPASGRYEKHPPASNPASRFPSGQMQALEEDDNKRVFLGKALRNILAVSRAFETPVQSDAEIIERLNWFFQTCAETKQLPTIEKLCLALGWTYEHFVGVLSCKYLPFSENTSIYLQQAKGIIASLDAELATEGKIQPVVYIFRAKNYYSMTDRQELTVQHTDDIKPISEETLREKYKDAIIVEVPGESTEG